MTLNDRSRNILNAVIVSYIRTAAPVGSRSITKVFDFGLSPASIRNVMADLEDLGFLAQPHTSAGRVPTEKAFRMYVESLIDTLPGTDSGELIDHNFLGTVETPQKMLQEASRLLSDLSHYAGLVLAPNAANTSFERIEVIRLRHDHVLVLLVSADGLIYNRVIAIEDDFSDADLVRVNSILNEQFRGFDLQEIRSRLLEQMRAHKREYDTLLARALELGQKAIAGQPETEVYLGGASNILDLPEFADADRMKGIFRAFEEKARMVTLLNKCLESDGVQVYIGSDNAFSGLEGCSLVISSYKKGNHAIGSLGVIGPMRMNYDKVIPLVDQTARAVSRLMEQE